MTPSTSGFQEPDHDLPAGSGPVSGASTTFHEELRGMLGTEMARHQPDSDRIRRRLAAAVGQPLGGSSVFPLRQPGSVSPFTTRPGAVPHDRPEAAAPTVAGPPPAPYAGPESTTPTVVGAGFTPYGESAAYAESALYAEAEPYTDAEVAASGGLGALIDLAGPPDLDDPTEEADRAGATTPLPLDALYGTRRGHASAAPPRRGQGLRRTRPGRGAPRGTGRRRTQALVGAAVTVLSLALVALVALLDLPGSDSSDPPTTTVTARPNPTETPWATTSATLAPSRPPAVHSPPPPGPSAGVPRGQASPAGSTAAASAAGAAEPGDAARPSSGTSAQPLTRGTKPDPAAPAQDGAGAVGAGQAPNTGLAPSATGIYTNSVAPFPAGSRVQIPGAQAADWALFGAGWGGVQNRAALPVPLLAASVVGVPTTSSSGFDWSGGMPTASGTDDTDRLAVQGTAALSTFVTQARTLEIYLGSSSGRVEITVSSLADRRTFTVQLPSTLVDGSADARVSVSLPAGIGATTVSISSGSSAAWTLAAAVLR
ncbi:hypothetical protein [Frankia sp. QA3]|uniref:hypothetical protein n=1 Tax=Frankia sp. QA3 TaxID=710111 RepID=UPI000269CB4D|nr:hypothetical protein [Frankia sp. QA3]EIV95308.1 hypothetical protein FraQA3DRAFT_5118 [Frankia sp. QA3]